MKNFMILESNNGTYRFGLHLEKTEFGAIGILNFHFIAEGEFELLLTDSMGENFYAKMSENPYSFSLPPNFLINGMVTADIFKDGILIASGVSERASKNKVNYGKDLGGRQEQLESTLINDTNENYLKEAQFYINKAKELYREESNKDNNKNLQKATFFDSIKDDFELLYSIGAEDYLLKKKFKNSLWRKVDISGEVYILGKIYAGAGVVGEEYPSFIALAIPTTKENANNEKPLGEKARFYHANIYDNFGFLVLVESVVSGKVVNL